MQLRKFSTLSDLYYIIYKSKHLTVLVSQIFGKLVENVGVTLIWQGAVAASSIIAIELEWHYLIWQIENQGNKLEGNVTLVISTANRVANLPVSLWFIVYCINAAP